MIFEIIDGNTATKIYTGILKSGGFMIYKSLRPESGGDIVAITGAKYTIHAHTVRNEMTKGAKYVLAGSWVRGATGYELHATSITFLPEFKNGL